MPALAGLLSGRRSRAVDPNVTRLRQIRDLLESWGHTVIEVPGWETRGAGSWSPIAWLWHHTAGPRSGDTPSLRVCTFGRVGLRNALCNTYTSRSGVIYIVAARRAWHAGTGTIVTNSRSGGNEGENTGLGESWTGSYAAQVALAAAIAIVIGIDPAKQWDHKEHAKGRKIDRAGIAPTLFRADVAAFITSKTAPTPPPGRNDDHMIPFDTDHPDARGVRKQVNHFFTVTHDGTPPHTGWLPDSDRIDESAAAAIVEALQRLATPGFWGSRVAPFDLIAEGVDVDWIRTHGVGLAITGGLATGIAIGVTRRTGRAA